ncbi:hypothetical protein [Halomicronema hongdechloris]|nr:hypothetical protein [Halomicronema hongdechloris]
MADIVSLEFWVWLVVIGGTLAVGMISMSRAYLRPPSKTLLFPRPQPQSSLPLSQAARLSFEQGCEAFKQQQFRRTIDRFAQVIAAEPNCAEAFHNRGLMQANLGNDNYAIADLLQASDLYDRQGTKAGLEQVKAQLQQMATRSQDK